MSDNLSIEEIIKRAEEIRSRAEEQLASAEKKLDEQAKSAIDEIVVDEKSVVEKITTLLEEEEDIKEFVPSKSQKVPAVRIEAEGDDEEIKIAPDFSKNKDKTRTVTFGGDDDIKIAKPEKTDNKTRTMAFVSKPKVDKESDLQEMPTIVARENIYDGFDVSANPTPFIEDTGEQITFEGFDDKIEVVPTIDEDVAEQILEERRREKVVKFRLFGPDETDLKLGNSEEVKEEYNSKSETDDFLQNLLASSKAQKTRSILSAAVLALLLLLTVSKDSAYLPSFLANHTAYFIVALIIYIAAIGINIKSFIHGFKIKKHINFDFAISALNVAILVHTAALLINNSLWIDNGTLLASFGAFSLTMSSLGKSKMLKRAIDNFKFITSSREKYTVENITNNIDAEKICRGLVSEEPIIKTSVKTDFPTNFLEISYKNEPANKVAGTVLPIALLLNLILFVAVGIIDNFNSAFNMLLCGLSVSLPCCSLFLTNSTLCDVSNALRDYGSRVCGYEGAAMAYNANTMVLEAADLFSKNSCEMHGIKTFDNAKVDDAILQAAAVMIQTKSPVAHVFDDVIIGKQSILPKVEKISYEDKMGTSAWIYNKKILVGNRAMLKNHGVSVPSESFEKKHSIRGRKVLYLSVDGKLTAMFVFSYSANPDLKRELKKLEKSGITIIVKSTDPHINEKSIAKLFNLPEGFIRVMNSSSAMVYEKYSNMHVEKSPAYVVHNGSALGFVSAMRAAEIIVSQRKLIKFLCFFGSALGFAAIALLSLLGAYSQISAVSIILFHLIWNLFVLMISKLRGISL